jgi:hypothetical protein
MTKRLPFVFLFVFISYPAMAQSFGQSLVITLEDDAMIQLYRLADGTQVSGGQSERISGGATARFDQSGIDNAGGPASSWLAVDFRMQSKSWSVAFNPQPCRGHLLTLSSPTGMNTAAGFDSTSHFFSLDPAWSNGSGCPGTTVPGSNVGLDTVLLNIDGTNTTGAVFCGGFYTGTLYDPTEIPGLSCQVTFGTAGLAIITGTLRAEVSDYPATVVKLRQGIGNTLPNFLMMNWSDKNPPWEDDFEPADGTYLDTGPPPHTATIYNIGCRLTSFSMALNSEGIHYLPNAYCGPPRVPASNCPAPTMVLNDPGSLNTFASKPSMQYGYLPNGVIEPLDVLPALSQASALNTHLLYNPFPGPGPCASAVPDNFLACALSAGHPVIVGVEDPPTPGCSNFPCHYVLVWGKRSGEWLIADPWPTIPSTIEGILVSQPRLHLSDWGHYLPEAYITATDPPDYSSLNINTASEVELLLTGPTGEHTGFDSAAGAVVEDSGAYFVDSIADDTQDGFSTGSSRSVFVPQPSDGAYTLAVAGLSLGTYSVIVHPYSRDESIQPVVNVAGLTGPRSASTFKLQLSTVPGSTTVITRSATPTSAMEDFENSLRLGLITNKRLAESLSDKLHKAGQEEKEGECHEARDILRRFKDEVEDHIGKGIEQLTAQVLTEDAEYLIHSCKESKDGHYKESGR